MAITLIIKGIIIGVAAIIPGVSGSVFAVVTGVYDDMIFAISNIRKSTKKSILFLLPIVSGILLGVLLAANPVLEVCNKFPLYSYCFFIGIMLGSLPTPVAKLKTLGRIKPKQIIIAAACFLIVVALRFCAALSGAGNLVTIPSISGFVDLLALFLCGFVSVGVMALPGVSGSVTLMVLGFYGTIYKAAGSPARLVKSIVEWDKSSALAAVDGTLLLIPFLIGGALGFFAASKFISAELKSNPKSVYMAVIGFITGSAVTLVVDGILPATKVFSGGNFIMWLLIFAFTLSGGLLIRVFNFDKK
ncbi:MAG: DUF368 domain-containing protein [Clostridia bacterium]|nr:DUF368 domain-containing protein [Clostridia bacterium]